MMAKRLAIPASLLLLQLLAVTVVQVQSSMINGLRADDLGCRWTNVIDGDLGSVGSTRVRTCFTAYRSILGPRTQLSAHAAAALCRRLHDGWLASLQNAAVQSWLEQSLNQKYVSTTVAHRSVAEFWFGAELVGLTKRQWSWSGNTFSGWWYILALKQLKLSYKSES